LYYQPHFKGNDCTVFGLIVQKNDRWLRFATPAGAAFYDLTQIGGYFLYQNLCYTGYSQSGVPHGFHHDIIPQIESVGRIWLAPIVRPKSIQWGSNVPKIAQNHQARDECEYIRPHTDAFLHPLRS